MIVLNKKDEISKQKLNQLKYIMRIDTIVSQAGKHVSVQEVSSVTGEGVEELRKWLDQSN